MHPADIAQTVGYLPQNPSALFFAETLRAELAFTLKHHRQSGLDPEATLASLGLEHAIDRNPRDLSGGERERAALAAVLVGGPRVLLLDEPTRGMDAARKRALVATLHRLRDDGVAILLATHDVELVAEVASRVVLLGDGRIVADGGPRTVLSGSLTFTTAVNKLYGDGFLTPGDILAGFGLNLPGELTTSTQETRVASLPGWVDNAVSSSPEDSDRRHFEAPLSRRPHAPGRPSVAIAPGLPCAMKYDD